MMVVQLAPATKHRGERSVSPIGDRVGDDDFVRARNSREAHRMNEPEEWCPLNDIDAVFVLASRRAVQYVSGQGQFAGAVISASARLPPALPCPIMYV